MNARIDIRTPAGKSLEGFPQEVLLKPESYTENIYGIMCNVKDYLDMDYMHELHKGDTITIEIL